MSGETKENASSNSPPHTTTTAAATTTTTLYQSTGVTDGDYFHSHYTNVKMLKKAIYGQVNLCYHKDTKKQVAIKIIHPKKNFMEY